MTVLTTVIITNSLSKLIHTFFLLNRYDTKVELIVESKFEDVWYLSLTFFLGLVACWTSLIPSILIQQIEGATSYCMHDQHGAIL